MSTHRPPSTDSSPDRSPRHSFLNEKATAGQLPAYFRSGWAFLIPYLAAYLLYAWLKWPVNPEGAVKAIGEISVVAGAQLSTLSSQLPTVPPSTVLPSTGIRPPCLLHVYWFLHALHLILGAIALRSWWLDSGETVNGETDNSPETANRATPSQPCTVERAASRQPPTDYRPASTVPLRGNRSPASRLYAAIPWLCLALIFWIPGVYLEWPADPWEHLRRINEWHFVDIVTAHSAWMKSSYFIPYSMLSWTAGLQQIFWLDCYYTGICLLLCWQYYRLARACDLGERASMAFVILQALLFGNNIFSFYRYYGISSSIYAQLGTVALTRLALEAGTKSQLLSLCSLFRSLSSFNCRSPETTTFGQIQDRSPRRVRAATENIESTTPVDADGHETGTPSKALRDADNNGAINSPGYFLWSFFLLSIVILFNHRQGIGIVALGITAVVIWRLIEWRRSMIGWLTTIAIGLSVITILWYPRAAALDEFYRPAHWLTDWYGFNLFSPASAAFDRCSAIVGFLGLLNLLAGLYLLRRNHIVAWLTLIPIAVLSLPFAAIPFASSLASKGSGEIITFHRMFFSIPAGLALIALGNEAFAAVKRVCALPNFLLRTPILSPITLLVFWLFVMTIAPPNRPCFNRLYNVFMRPPADLSLRDASAVISSIDPNLMRNRLVTIVTPGLAFTNDARTPQGTISPIRLVAYAHTTQLPLIDSFAFIQNRPPGVFAPRNGMNLQSPGSLSGYLSGHWLTQKVSLEHMGEPESKRLAQELGCREEKSGLYTYYSWGF